MDYRQLGRSGLRVSTITLGTMGFGGTGWAAPVGQIDVEGARKQIGLARDAGVNLFDTADVYSDGLSEEILGKALGSDRDEVLIATKVRGKMGDGPNDMPACLGTTSSGARRTVCGGSAPITSTSTRFTNGTGRRHSRKPCKRSMILYGPARSATSAAPTTQHGKS